SALGVKFFSSADKLLEPVGRNLSSIHRIDATQLHPRIADVHMTIFCDVDNPLHGPQGAANIFAPQKGADSAMVALLDDGLQHYQSILERTFDKPVNFPGAGAGGGLPASLKAFTNLTVRPGMDFIIEYTRLEEQVHQADVIITGEGKVDEQTLSGKVVSGVAQLARRYNKPLIVIAGKCELSPEQVTKLGIQKVITLINTSLTEDYAIKNASSLLKQRILENLEAFFIS
ncbi:MAG TPA: glycerate kinase, partial [Ohtaekwangia sp.]|uniref:glycerate kinase n=1 Tax=Ohtaekwangia sp. TaxID=2066019 RepID=UPI002F92FC16